jgi:hypothetical protein
MTKKMRRRWKVENNLHGEGHLDLPDNTNKCTVPPWDVDLTLVFKWEETICKIQHTISRSG